MTFRRNLLIVLAHGLRSDALGDSGAWPLATPNLAKLAQAGVRLVASSACPADPGGLVSLLTGLHARQHGHVEQAPVGMVNRLIGESVNRSESDPNPYTPNPSPQPLAPSPDSAPGSVHLDGLAAWLAAAGYHLAGVGCVGAIEPYLKQAVLVENPAAVDPPGCAYMQAAAGKGLRHALAQQRRQRLRYGPFEPDRLLLEPDDDIDGFIAVQARRMLAHMPADRPWAMFVILSGPANDLPPPTIYGQIVDPASVSGGFMPADLTAADALVELDYPRVLLQRLDPEKIGRIRADYLGRVSLIDYGVGRLQTVLEARPDRDHTWLVLGSDRGQLLGEHGLVGHRSFLCGAVEVPLLIVPPTPAGRLEHDLGLMSSVDVAPTVAALGGCDLPRAVAGRSLLSIFYGAESNFPTLPAGEAGDPMPPQAFSPFDGEQSSKTPHHPSPSPAPGCALVSEFGRRLMLETERYKIVFDTDTHAALGLYDLLNDADEDHNLLDTPKGRNLLDSLRWRLGDALLPLRALPR